MRSNIVTRTPVELAAAAVLASRTLDEQREANAEARAAYIAWVRARDTEAESNTFWEWLDADARRNGRPAAYRTQSQRAAE